jgi:hypothetical protein
MRRGGKSAHVGADFGENHLGVELADARAGDQQFDAGAKGRDALIDRAVNLTDGGIKGINLLEMLPQEKAVMRHDPAAQGFAQLIRCCLDAPIGKSSERDRIGLTRNDGFDHSPTG